MLLLSKDACLLTTMCGFRERDLSPLCVVTQAVLEGLSFAKGKDLGDLTVFSDCKGLVDMLNRSSKSFLDVRPFLDNIWLLASGF